MAGSVNKVILVGNLGKDPEARILEGNVKKVSFPLATSETFKDKDTGERRNETEWHNIVMWRGLADVGEKYLRKGNQIYIEGKLKSRSWKDKEGNTRYITEIVAENFVMMNRNESQRTSNTNDAGTSDQSGQFGDENTMDDLPF